MNKLTEYLKNKKHKQYMQDLVNTACKVIQNDDLWAVYLNKDFFRLDQIKISEHNAPIAFHSTIWHGLEPHQKMAAVILLNNKIINEKTNEYAPNKKCRFIVGDYKEDDYFCKRDYGINYFYINSSMFTDDLIEPYAFVQMLFGLQLQAKAYEELEHKTVDDKFLESVKFNVKNKIERTEAYNKFLLQEDMSLEEKKQASLFICQPIEQSTKLFLEKIEDIHFLATDREFGLNMEDPEWEYFKDDSNYFNEKEDELFQELFGKNESKFEVYKKAVEKQRETIKEHN